MISGFRWTSPQFWANYGDRSPPVGHPKWWFRTREVSPKSPKLSGSEFYEWFKCAQMDIPNRSWWMPLTIVDLPSSCLFLSLIYSFLGWIESAKASASRSYKPLEEWTKTCLFGFLVRDVSQLFIFSLLGEFPIDFWNIGYCRICLHIGFSFFDAIPTSKISSGRMFELEPCEPKYQSEEKFKLNWKPIASMYDIFTYIYPILYN